MFTHQPPKPAAPKVHVPGINYATGRPSKPGAIYHADQYQALSKMGFRKPASNSSSEIERILMQNELANRRNADRAKEHAEAARREAQEAKEAAARAKAAAAELAAKRKLEMVEAARGTKERYRGKHPLLEKERAASAKKPITAGSRTKAARENPARYFNNPGRKTLASLQPTVSRTRYGGYRGQEAGARGYTAKGAAVGRLAGLGGASSLVAPVGMAIGDQFRDKSQKDQAVGSLLLEKRKLEEERARREEEKRKRRKR